MKEEIEFKEIFVMINIVLFFVSLFFGHFIWAIIFLSFIIINLLLA